VQPASVLFLAEIRVSMAAVVSCSMCSPQI
jgi:hypothetical protein